MWLLMDIIIIQLFPHMVWCFKTANKKKAISKKPQFKLNSHPKKYKNLRNAYIPARMTSMTSFTAAGNLLASCEISRFSPHRVKHASLYSIKKDQKQQPIKLMSRLGPHGSPAAGAANCTVPGPLQLWTSLFPHSSRGWRLCTNRYRHVKYSQSGW